MQIRTQRSISIQQSMNGFIATVVALIVVASLASETCWAISPEELGIEMSRSAYEAVCWYEYAKSFPKTDTRAFARCVGKADRYKEQILHEPSFELFLNSYSLEFADLLTGDLMSRLPNQYQSKCEKYLKEPKAVPEADESDSLKDGGKAYPFKGFSYCLMNTLRKSHGDKAIQAVKNEKTHSKKDWKKTIFDRENEARMRHTVEPLKILEELNQSAQKWAEVNAKECRMYHSRIEDRMYKGKVTVENLKNLAGYTGENLMTGSANMDKTVAAYISSNGWYEEISLYPYPDGYQGQGNPDPFFRQIGHFTQMVWKKSKYVGYGFANNPKCRQGTYLVAHYYPIGNVIGKFSDNVTPPKDA